jgi:hypothetical protein
LRFGGQKKGGVLVQIDETSFAAFSSDDGTPLFPWIWQSEKENHHNSCNGQNLTSA